MISKHNEHAQVAIKSGRQLQLMFDDIQEKFYALQEDNAPWLYNHGINLCLQVIERVMDDIEDTYLSDAKWELEMHNKYYNCVEKEEC